MACWGFCSGCGPRAVSRTCVVIALMVGAFLAFDPIGDLREVPPVEAVAIERTEFNEDNGMLTPSLKVKRHRVTTAYAAEIEALYRK